MMLRFPLAQDEVFDSATIATNEDGKTMSGQGHEVGALTQFQIRETSFCTGTSIGLWSSSVDKQRLLNMICRACVRYNRLWPIRLFRKTRLRLNQSRSQSQTKSALAAVPTGG